MAMKNPSITSMKVFNILSLTIFYFILPTGEALPQDPQINILFNKQLKDRFNDSFSTSGPTPPSDMCTDISPETLDYEVVIPDVPAYLWYNGCGPTAAGTVIGYWDGKGFDNLVEGSADTQTLAVNEMISSPDNYDDYCLPIDFWPNFVPDLSEPPTGDEHPNDCVADFMKTSQSASGMTYGGTWFSDIAIGLSGYAQLVDPRYKATAIGYSWMFFKWQKFCTQIDKNRPVILLVDINGDGGTDHFITAIGYGEQEGTPMYACYHQFDTDIHWYEFAKMAPGQPWGYNGAITFKLEIDSITTYVPDDHPTIQDALNASVGGDTIIVKPGTYVENINFGGRAVTLKSEQGPEVTVIDGGFPVDPEKGSAVTFEGNEGSDSVIEGFTITNGTGTCFDGLVEHGGGIFCRKSSPTIINNIVTQNSAYFGGGIHSGSNSSPAIIDNAVMTNSAVHGGGISMDGLALSSPIIYDNNISGNSATGNGGGIFWYGDSSKIIIDNIIKENTASYGGGIYAWVILTTPPELTNNVIKGNQADYGGGIAFTLTPLIITNNNIIENIAAQEGGGIWCFKSSPTITNSILWNNNAATGKEICLAKKPSTLDISYSNLEGGQSSVHLEPECNLNWGAGMIDADPLFVDVANGDLHLTYSSPCKDTGDNTIVTELTDFEGDPRMAYGIVDMGADEFYTHLYVMGNKTPGGTIQGKFVGLPGTNPVGLFIGAGVNPSPINTLWGEFWLQAPWFLFWPLGAIPADGVMVLPTTLPTGMPVPVDVPMQALIGLNADSLTNLCVLEVR